MKIGKWDDGYSLDADPRREDPLYYYLKDKDWSGALGIAVDPMCHEHEVAEVRISIFGNHSGRYAGMTSEEQGTMLTRIIDSLLKRHRNWVTVKGLFG